ncbi:alpha-amylase family protein [Edaphobacter flagellatus]|uniref:alpha-amylase family protein n=1 Tax=Edaphobacter flagellatus TaxID=1933044 RepID=UPI0021B45DE9|nr:alpha-amylase family protein [Edaphobacter flagellatus]
MNRRDMLKLSALTLGASAVSPLAIAQNATRYANALTGNRELAEWIHGNRTLIAEAYNPPFYPALDYVPARGVEIAKVLNCDSMRYPVASYVAYFPTKSGYPIHPELKGDPMKEQVGLLREAGMHPIAYIPFNHPFMLHGEKVERYENWKRRRPDGSPMVTKHYGFNQLDEGCLNSPIREMIVTLVKEVLTYGFDVMYFDGPYQGMDNATEWCYCQYCKTAYRKRFGHDIPVQKEASLDQQIEYVNWMREDVSISFFKEIRDMIRNTQDVPVLFNNSGLLSRGDQWRARAIPEADGFMYEAADTPEEKFFNLQLGKSTGRTTWTYLGHHTQYNRDHMKDKSVRGWYSYPIEGEELLMDGAIATASNVGCVYWSVARFFYEKESPVHFKSGQYVKGIFDFQEANDGLLRSLTTKPQVGILVNAEAMSWYRSPSFDPGTFKNYHHGAFDLMKALSIDAEPFLDWQMNGESLFRYAAVYIPNAPCLSDEQCDMLRNYVEGGGNLIATHRTSIADKYGRPRKDFGLADLFGASLLSPEPWEYPDLYLKPSSGDLIPQDPQIMRVKRTDGDVLATTWNRGQRKDEGPAIFRKKFGRGQCLYIASGLEAVYEETRMNPLLAYLGSIMMPMLEDAQLYKMDYRPGLMAHYTEGADKIVLHIIANIANDDPHQKVRHAYCSVENVQVQLRTPRPIRTASLLRAGEAIEVGDRKDGWTTLTVPHVHIYEAILIGLA